MKLALIFFLAAAVGTAQQSPAPEAATQKSAKIADIEDLLSTMKTERTQQQYMAQIQPMPAQQVNGVVGQISDAEARAKMGADIQEFQKQILEFIAKLLDYQKLKPEYVRIYDEAFSADEIAALLRFYKSPIGQAYVDKLPVVLTRSMNMAQQVMRDAAPELMQMTNAWAEKMKAKYEK